MPTLAAIWLIPSSVKSANFLLLLLFFGSTAQALQELGSVENLPAMSEPDSRAIGWEWHFIDQDDKPGYMRKVAGKGKVASYTCTDGCEWSRSTQGFAPAFQWRNCPSSGISRVEHVDGYIWPLDLGKKLSYRVTGTSTLFGRAWSSKRECAVVAAVRIKIVSGSYDTFRVECKERWGTRTWWLPPEVGTAVAYQQTTRRGDYLLQEMTKIVIP